MPGMLDALASRFYQGRPLTKTIPFNVTTVGVTASRLWVPDNAYFEVQRIYIIASVAAIDLNIVDTGELQIFAFVMPSTVAYTPVDFAPSTYRSVNFASNWLGIADPAGNNATFKGFIEGWEVTREGSYR